LEELQKKLRGEDEGETRQRIASKEELVRTLQMMHRRLKAEVKWREHKEMRLLAFLVNEADEQKRARAMSSAFKSLEFIESFLGFLEAGIEHLRTHGNIGVEGPNAEESVVELSPGTLEKMRDILEDVQTFRDKVFGYGDRANEVVFSEEAEASKGEDKKKNDMPPHMQ